MEIWKSGFIDSVSGLLVGFEKMFSRGVLMSFFSWPNIFLRMLVHPPAYVLFLSLPRSYKTLEEWLAVDMKKVTLVAQVIKCKNEESLKKQQIENMVFRKRHVLSFPSWMQLCKDQPTIVQQIDEIAMVFKKSNLCHRDYAKGGVVCFCKH
jgi:hypothetical protein